MKKLARKTNAQSAFDNYIMWLSWYPNDYKGATEQASSFIDTIQDMDEFQAMVKAIAGK